LCDTALIFNVDDNVLVLSGGVQAEWQLNFRQLLPSVILLFCLECSHVRTVCKQQKLLNEEITET
jgi:hypothetical protein